MEILKVADSLARDKGIDKEIVISAMEEAIEKAGRSKYGEDNDIRAEVDRDSGDIKLTRHRIVVEEYSTDEELEEQAAKSEGPESAEENGAPQDSVKPRGRGVEIPIAQAKRIKKGVEVGDEIVDELPPIDFGRIAAQTAKQVIKQKVREAEREREYEEFKDRVGEMITGIVKRVDYGNVILDLGRGEAIMKRNETLPREFYKQGDRIRTYIYKVERQQHGAQIYVSRTHPEFMKLLFNQEVPEVYDGIIEIKAVARDPGSRAKIAVFSNDASIDPVGACVGMRGSRVQAVVNELQGEKIDIIPWEQNPASFVVNALAPAEVEKVVMDEQAKRLDVVVPEDELSLAIGRRGQNVRLASILTGWDIDILTDEEESERRAEEARLRSEMFMECLDVDDVIAHLLIAEGFATIEDVAFTPVEELARIEGFDEDVAVELRNRAVNFIEAREEQLINRLDELDLNEDLLTMEELTTDMLVSLGEEGITTLDDFAGLASDELREIVGERKLTLDEANDVIMKAREHWFEEENSESEEAVA
jgi:N utilization substance protein A